MAGQNFVPFPRQTLLGTGVGTVTYTSDTMDVTAFGSVAWTFHTMGVQPGVVSNPARYYVQEANYLDGPWTDLNPGGTAPNFGVPTDGDAAVTASLLRVQVVVDQGEAATVEVRLVGRSQ
jgi:hypothetical protein